MGLIAAVARFFGSEPTSHPEVRVIPGETPPAADSAGHSERAAVAAIRRGEPVEVKTGTPELSPSATPAAAIEPKPRTEIAPARPLSPETLEANRVAELREQYEKVVSLIEKVDKHLDTQEERSKRLIDVMEKFPAEALAKLEGLSENQNRMSESLSTMNATMQETLDGVSSSFGELALSNERLGEVLAAMKQREEARERRLQEHMEHTVKHHQAMQKWMVGMLVLGSLGVAAALVVAVFLVVGPGAPVPS